MFSWSRPLGRILALLLVVSGFSLGVATGSSAAPGSTADRSGQGELNREPVKGVDPTLEATAVITGVVFGPRGFAHDNVRVEAIPAADPAAPPVATGLSYGGPEGHGSYELHVPAGDYLVRFSSQEWTEDSWYQDFETQLYGGGAGTVVSVGDGETETLADVTMREAQGAPVSGRLLDSSGVPVDGGYVTLWRYHSSGAWAIDGTYTDSTGHYTFEHATAGKQHTVQGSGGWTETDGYLTDADTFLGGQATDASATKFTVPTGGHDAGDLRLVAGGSVSGVVTDAEGQPMEWTDVDAMVKRPDGGFDYARYGYTDEDGRFTISRIFPGVDHTLYFYGYNTHESVFLGGGDDEATAQLFRVAAGANHDAGTTVLGIDSSPATGTVVDTDGDPVEWAEVELWQRYTEDGETWWDNVDWTDTDEEGGYDFRMKWGRTYTISASLGGERVFLGGAATAATADPVTPPQDSPPIAVDPIALSIIDVNKLVGSVVDAGDAAVAGADVTLWVNQDGFWDWWDSARTGALGKYRFRGVPEGVPVTVSASKQLAAMGEVFLGQGDSPETATPLTFETGQLSQTAGPITLSPAPDSIIGAVLPAAGQELDDQLSIELYELVDDGMGGIDLWWAGSYSSYPGDGETGEFAFTGLAPGSYALRVTPEHYWWDEDRPPTNHAMTWTTGARPASAQDSGIIILTGDAPAQVDVPLDRGVLLKGTVSKASGGALSDVDLMVGEWFTSGGWDGYDTFGYDTALDGGYAVRVPSHAELSLEAWRANYADYFHGSVGEEAYDGIRTPAETITTDGADVTVDFSMTPEWGSIGTVAGVQDEACLANAGYEAEITVAGQALTVSDRGVITRRDSELAWNGDDPLDALVREPALAPLASEWGESNFTWGSRAGGEVCIQWNSYEATYQALLKPALAGGIDVTYNYDRVEQSVTTGEFTARQMADGDRVAGYTEGEGEAGDHVLFPGARVPGAYNDTNTETGLVNHNVGSTQPGRYQFHFDGFALRGAEPQNTVEPTITGATEVGDTLTADPGSWTVDGQPATGLEFQYTWLRSGWKEVGTGKTYVLQDNDRRKRMVLEVQAWTAGHEPGFAHARIRIPAGPPAATNTVAPLLTPDNPAVGDTLTSTEGTWTATDGTMADVTLETRWFRNGRRIWEASGSTYELTADDSGRTIKTRVIATREGYATVRAFSNEVTAQEAPIITPTSGVVVTGDPKVGATLDVEPGTWGPDGTEASFSYRWIVGATTRAGDGTDPSKLTLRTTDEGKYVTAVITASADGFRNGTFRATVGPIAAGTVAIAGFTGTAVTSGGQPVAGASWSACETSTWSCIPGSVTSATGSFTGKGHPNTAYSVTVYAPEGSNLRNGYAQVSLPASGNAVVEVVLEEKSPPPPNVSLPTQNGEYDGMPTVYYGDPQVIEVTGCEVTNPSYTVTFAEGFAPMTGAMTVKETLPSGLKVYTATIPPFYPRHGESTIATNVAATCGGEPTSFKVYIDPSGVVTDQYGQPIQGASVTLLRSDNAGGPFTVVPDGSDIMSEDNRANPSTTDAVGFFRWDVTEGWYQVTAAKSGCASLTSPAMQVNPPRVDLLLKLTCDAAAPSVTPTIQGDPTVGATLQTNEEDWADLFGVDLQWQRDGVDITGATGTSYTVTGADAGKKLTVEHTAKRSDYVQEEGRGTPVTFQAIEAESAVVTGKLGAAPTVKTAGALAGSGKVGTQLTATDPVWTESGVTTTREWLVAGTPVAGETAATYTVRAGDVGKAITVRFTGSRGAGYQPGTASAGPVTGAKADSRTTLKAPKKIVLKKISKAVFTITVAAAGVVGPTGALKLLDGKKKIKATVLTAAQKGIWKIKGKQLKKQLKKKGKHKLKAVYAGDGAVNGSTSKVVTITIK